LIVVSQRIDHIEDRNEFRDALDQRLANWLIISDFFPVPIPNKLVAENNSDILVNWIDAIDPQAIILSGGNDIGEYPLRDKTEKILLEYAVDRIIPVLGLCRGLQMMAHHAGTQLVSVEGHVAARHKLKCVPDSRQGIPEEVNSYHTWGLTQCPDGYETLATAPDGTLEAIRHRKLPWEGWMWHPEREEPFSTIDSQRFNNLIYSG
jgi:putative glutamine amidotransferase